MKRHTTETVDNKRKSGQGGGVGEEETYKT